MVYVYIQPYIMFNKSKMLKSFLNVNDLDLHNASWCK